MNQSISLSLPKACHDSRDKYNYYLPKAKSSFSNTMLINVVILSDVSTFVQFTSVLFRLLLTGLTSNLDVSGKLLPAELTEKVNMTEFTSKVETGELGPRNRAYFLAAVSPSGIKKKLYSRKPPIMVHVN